MLRVYKNAEVISFKSGLRHNLGENLIPRCAIYYTAAFNSSQAIPHLQTALSTLWRHYKSKPGAAVNKKFKSGQKHKRRLLYGRKLDGERTYNAFAGTYHRRAYLQKSQNVFKHSHRPRACRLHGKHCGRTRKALLRAYEAAWLKGER